MKLFANVLVCCVFGVGSVMAQVPPPPDPPLEPVTEIEITDVISDEADEKITVTYDYFVQAGHQGIIKFYLPDVYDDGYGGSYMALTEVYASSTITGEASGSDVEIELDIPVAMLAYVVEAKIVFWGDSVSSGLHATTTKRPLGSSASDGFAFSVDVDPVWNLLPGWPVDWYCSAWDFVVKCTEYDYAGPAQIDFELWGTNETQDFLIGGSGWYPATQSWGAPVTHTIDHMSGWAGKAPPAVTLWSAGWNTGVMAPAGAVATGDAIQWEIEYTISQGSTIATWHNCEPRSGTATRTKIFYEYWSEVP